MILTVTLNPALDKTYRTDVLITGQVNRMKSVSSFPGGKGINVAKVLRQLGKEVIATGFLGGYNGIFIRDELKKMGIGCDFVTVSSETRSNMNIIAQDGFVTEILEPGPTVSKEELEAFMNKYQYLLTQTNLVILSGSAANGIGTDIYKTLIELANKAGKKTFLDTSGELLIKGIEAGPYFVKPNKKEMEALFGKHFFSVSQIAQSSLELCEKHVSKVVVSMGKQGMVVTDSKQSIHAIPPKVDAINTVGSGDSAVAAFAAALEEHMEEEEAIRFAAAVSAANVTTMENGQIPMEMMNKLLKEIEFNKICIQ